MQRQQGAQASRGGENAKNSLLLVPSNVLPTYQRAACDAVAQENHHQIISCCTWQRSGRQAACTSQPRLASKQMRIAHSSKGIKPCFLIVLLS
jgi:hypothetical protein